MLPKNPFRYSGPGPGVKSFDEKNPNFSNETKGHIMTCYIGGRTECKIRKTPALSDVLDVLSMYPTVCTLQNLWRFVTAKRIESQDSTDEIRKLVDAFKLEDIQNKDIWKKFPAIVQIQPNEDVLPLRAKYGKKHEWNIGLPYISYEGKLWYSLADVLASKLYTGKSPTILTAISFIPETMYCSKPAQKPNEAGYLIMTLSSDPNIFSTLVNHDLSSNTVAKYSILNAIVALPDGIAPS